MGKKLSLALMLLLAACSGDNQQAYDARAQPLVIGFSQIGAQTAWRMANTRSIQDAAKDAGVTLIYSDAERRQENQFKALRSFIDQRVDVIVLTPVVETGWEGVLREAKLANIPVILNNRAIEVVDDSLYASQIGSDYVEEGRRAARWLLEHSKDKRGDINIVELRGTLGSAPANDRKLGFSEIISSQPHYKIIRSESGEFMRAKGKEVMAALLKSERRRIDVLLSHNDDMTLSAIEALDEAGIKPGKDVAVISIGGAKEAFEAMAAGKINVIVECNPLLGPQLIAAAKDVAAGKAIPKRIVTEESAFPQEVAAQELPKRTY